MQAFYRTASIINNIFHSDRWPTHSFTGIRSKQRSLTSDIQLRIDSTTIKSVNVGLKQPKRFGGRSQFL